MRLSTRDVCAHSSSDHPKVADAAASVPWLGHGTKYKSLFARSGNPPLRPHQPQFALNQGTGADFREDTGPKAAAVVKFAWRDKTHAVCQQQQCRGCAVNSDAAWAARYGSHGFGHALVPPRQHGQTAKDKEPVRAAHACV